MRTKNGETSSKTQVSERRGGRVDLFFVRFRALSARHTPTSPEKTARRFQGKCIRQFGKSWKFAVTSTSPRSRFSSGPPRQPTMGQGDGSSPTRLNTLCCDLCHSGPSDVACNLGGSPGRATGTAGPRGDRRCRCESRSTASDHDRKDTAWKSRSALCHTLLPNPEIRVRPQLWSLWLWTSTVW